MSNLSSLLGALLALAATPAIAQTSDIAGQCTKVFAGAVSRVVTSSQLSVGVRTIYTQACTAKNRSLTGSFDSTTKALIEGVPVVNSAVGKLNIRSNSKFCQMYDSGAFELNQSNQLLEEPVVQAMEQANQCFEIANKADLILTHSVVDSGTVIFNGKFTTGDRFVRLTAAATKDFNCVSPVPDAFFKRVEPVAANEVKRAKPFEITCKRPGTADNKGNISRPAGAIAINTSEAGIYTVRIPADTTYGLASSREAEELINSIKVERDEARQAHATLEKQIQNRKLTVHRIVFGNTRDSESGQQMDAVKFRGFLPSDEWKTVGICKSGENGYVYVHKKWHSQAYDYISVVCESGLQMALKK